MPLIHQLTEESLLITKRELLEKTDENNSYINRKVIDAYIMWAEEMLDKIREKTLLIYIDAGIKVIGIGKLKIVTLPFEVFHDIGILLKKHFGENNTFVICYAKMMQK